MYGARGGVYRVLMEKLEGRRPLRRPRHRWDDDTKINLRELGWEGMEWINLAGNRDRWWAFVTGVMNLHVS
jgi:hypothetical protein